MTIREMVELLEDELDFEEFLELDSLLNDNTTDRGLLCSAIHKQAGEIRELINKHRPSKYKTNGSY